MTIEELKTDKAFMEKIENAESIAEIVALFKDKGIDVTEEQLEAAADYYGKREELSEDSLERVAGGIVDPISISLGIVIGVAIGKAISKIKRRR